MMADKKCLIEFFHKQKSITSNSCILPVVLGIVDKTKSYADSDLFLSIISGQWPVYEFNNKTEFNPIYGRNTFFI